MARTESCAVAQVRFMMSPWSVGVKPADFCYTERQKFSDITVSRGKHVKCHDRVADRWRIQAPGRPGSLSF